MSTTRVCGCSAAQGTRCAERAVHKIISVDPGYPTRDVATSRVALSWLQEEASQSRRMPIVCADSVGRERAARAVGAAADPTRGADHPSTMINSGKVHLTSSMIIERAPRGGAGGARPPARLALNIYIRSIVFLSRASRRTAHTSGVPPAGDIDPLH